MDGDTFALDEKIPRDNPWESLIIFSLQFELFEILEAEEDGLVVVADAGVDTRPSVGEKDLSYGKSITLFYARYNIFCDFKHGIFLPAHFDKPVVQASLPFADVGIFVQDSQLFFAPDLAVNNEHYS